MSTLSSHLRVWLPSAIASLSMVVMSSLVPARLGVGVAFSKASTVLASTVFRSLKPNSFRVSFEGVGEPSRLLG
jgi:C4-dicarboxylate transporter